MLSLNCYYSWCCRMRSLYWQKYSPLLIFNVNIIYNFILYKQRWRNISDLKRHTILYLNQRWLINAYKCKIQIPLTHSSVSLKALDILQWNWLHSFLYVQDAHWETSLTNSVRFVILTPRTRFYQVFESSQFIHANLVK